MRIEIDLPDELVADIDALVGPDARSEFVATAVRNRLREARWQKIWSAVGSISDEGHPWDPDPARWVHESRREDPRRVG